MEIKLSDYFPDLYSQFLPEFFNSLIEKEEIATCSNCIMLKPKNELGEQNYYSAKSKCCTFSPEIPNYLVGLILKDDSKEFDSGRKKIKEIIDSRVGVSPEGIKPSRKYSLMYEKGKQSSFGKSESLICPFFENKENSCSVWNGRSAICSTFFCRYNTGTFGENFWRNTQFYLQETEKRLSQYVILKLDAFTNYFDHSPNNDNFKLFEVDEKIHPDYSKIWGKYEKNEIDFYIKSYEIVSELTDIDFEKIMGSLNSVSVKKIQIAKNLMENKDLPEKLKLNNKANIIPVSESDFHISTPSGTFKVDKSLIEVLTLFNGKRNFKKIQEILDSKDIDIKNDLLLSFYHKQILVSYE